jgi:hypothetical protein
MTDTCSIIKYPSLWGFKREPARPVELRRDYFSGMKFDENFDWDNLWYDAVQLENGPVLLIGPPLYETGNFLKQNCNFFTTTGTVLPFQIIEMDRACITVIETATPLNEIILNPGDVKISINKQDRTFDNKIVFMTLQKNNPISWIREWILYHLVNYGISGVVIYDNRSDRYTASELEAAIQIPNVIVKVVEWNVPYGPQGFDCNYYNVWDSDYAQSSMFEHAKRRYVSNAKLVVNCDIDELIVIDNGDLSTVLIDLESSNVAGYCYKGRWIEPYDVTNNILAEAIPQDARSFKNYYCTDSRNEIGIGNKWMVIPNRVLNYQWSVHNCPMTIQSTSIYYGHYMPMNTNWSWKRDKVDRDTSCLKVEPILYNNLAKI